MSEYLNLKKIAHLTIILLIITLLLSLSIYLTKYVANDLAAQLFVQDFGYIGVLLISFIAGLNLFIPVPAATFIPIFTAGGISLLTAIPLLIIGTMTANLLSYVVGRLGNQFTRLHYPRIQQKIFRLYFERRELLPYLVFCFAAFIPVPDEVYLIPLGIIGVKLREFIVPLFLGTVFFQTMTALGFQNIFQIILN